jgi:hypothetical protein
VAHAWLAMFAIILWSGKLKSGVSSSFLPELKSGVSSSFLPEKMN